MFNSSDFYVLKNALDRAVLEAKSLIRVRTETLIEIGAKDLIPVSELEIYEAMEDQIKPRHASEVSTHALKAIVDELTCPADDQDPVPDPVVE